MSAAVYISLDEFLARPEREDDQREEWIEGELVVSPSAKVWHAAIVRRLRLGLGLIEEHGFVLVNDFACILGTRSMPAPDLAAVREQRWNEAELNRGWLEGSPELVIEVASPSNRRLHRKAEAYLEYGAEQVWIVYPLTNTVTVFNQQGTAEVRVGETINFHGIVLQTASIFGPNAG